MAKNGKLIVVDGIDGSGKATQTKILGEKLKQEGYQTETMDFPQYEENFFGGLVRQYLDGKFGKATEVDPHLSSLLYAGDRWESAPKIKQWLNQERIVVLDRYYTSNLIHQTPKLKESEIDDYTSWLHKLEFEIFKIPHPDLVIYLQVETAVAHQLIAQRGDGHDGHDTLDYMKITEQRGLYLAKKLNWQIVECCQADKLLSVDQIAEKIWQVVEKNI